MTKKKRDVATTYSAAAFANTLRRLASAYVCLHGRCIQSDMSAKAFTRKLNSR